MKRLGELCSECGRRIVVMCFLGTGVCCEKCRKDRDNDHGEARPMGAA